MKKLLPFAFIFLIACKKESVKSLPNGIVKYNIEGSSTQIVDSTSNSVARWIFLTTPSKGYALQAYLSDPGGEVSTMISLFIETDKLQPNQNYSQEVTGDILRNNTDYASTKDLDSTSIKINISKLENQTISGTFLANLKNLNTNELVEFTGSFDNVKLMQ